MRSLGSRESQSGSAECTRPDCMWPIDLKEDVVTREEGWNGVWSSRAKGFKSLYGRQRPHQLTPGSSPPGGVLA